MAGFKIPGVVGLGIDLPIDSGTLMRSASPAPVPVGSGNYLLDWVRREIGDRAGHALHHAGELAYQAALEEVQKLKSDLAATLDFIAKLPDGLRQRVAYEVFAAGFSHYLPKKFLRQYVWGEGAGLVLTQQEMVDCNPYIDLKRSKSFGALLVTARSQPGKAFPFESRVLAGALTNGSLGQFTVLTKASLVATADGAWKVQGTMSFYDEWDFDPKDFSTGGRSLQGELKTRLANAALPGTGFKISSAWVDFSQTQNDKTVVWVGGTPKAELDRIAATDAALPEASR